MAVIIKKKKTWTSGKLLLFGAVLVRMAGVVYMRFCSTGSAKLNVDPERLTISHVTRGPFQEFVPVDGVVMPIKPIYFDAPEGGMVQRIWVEDNATLRPGQPIIMVTHLEHDARYAHRVIRLLDGQVVLEHARG